MSDAAYYASFTGSTVHIVRSGVAGYRIVRRQGDKEYEFSCVPFAERADAVAYLAEWGLTDGGGF